MGVIQMYSVEIASSDAITLLSQVAVLNEPDMKKGAPANRCSFILRTIPGDHYSFTNRCTAIPPSPLRVML